MNCIRNKQKRPVDIRYSMKGRPFLYRSWAEVSLGQIVKNYKVYKECIGVGKKIIAVVKANAYGHGDVEISLALEAEGVDFFAVSNINEGIKLRKAGIKSDILVLGYTPPTYLTMLSKYGIMQTIVDKNHIFELRKYAPRDAKYHLAIDTGMRRIGLPGENREEIVKEIQLAASALKICGLFTHLPVADCKSDDDIKFTNRSVSLFDELAFEAKKAGIECIHCQNSAAGLLHNTKECNAIRLGISLYGYPPSPDVKLPQGILPALSWKSVVCHVFDVKKGESIGYGRSFVAQKNMKVATLTTGYADGYPRALSNRGYVLINGRFAAVVGRVCMDMMMVDVSMLPCIKSGDEVIIIGRSADKEITADDVAQWANTISYEILTGISARVTRIYKNSKKPY